MTDESNNHERRDYDEHTRQIAHEAATQAVTEMMQRLGIDDHDWQEQQKDIAYLRKLRTSCDQLGLWVARSVIVTVVGGLLYAVWQALKATK